MRASTEMYISSCFFLFLKESVFFHHMVNEFNSLVRM